MRAVGAFKSFLLACALVAPATPGAAAAGHQDNVIHWAGCGITRKAFMAELAAAFEAKTGTKIELHGGGATRGIRDTAALKVDMGGSCRMTLPEYDASEMHVTVHPVAWDALAIIVHKDNPVTNLSTDQIRAIYLGQITNWKALGGPDAPINLYVRQGNISGVGYAVRQYVFEDSSVEFVTKPEFVVKSSGPLEKAVEKDPYAMGITGISSARKRDVKVIGFDGKEPTYDNVAKGHYGLYRPLYLITSAAPSPAAREFIEFAQSDAGRAIIRQNGTVPYRDALNLMAKLTTYGLGVK